MQKIVILALFFTLGLSLTSANGNHDEFDHSVIISSQAVSASDEDIQRVHDEAMRSLNEICRFLEIYSPQKIYIKITDQGICQTQGGVISLPIKLVKYKKAAITHEITHLLANHSQNRFYSEGLAVFFQEKFGDDDGFPNFEGRDLNDIIFENTDNLIPLFLLTENNRIFSDLKNENRQLAYIEAGSFMTFLFDQYGKEKFLELHNGTPLSFDNVYGKELFDLEKEWK